MRYRHTFKSLRNLILWILTLIPVLITAIAVQFMPDSVPAHYDINGNIDRWGSKYENFIFPVIIIVNTLFWLLFIKFFQKRQIKESDDKKKKYAVNNETVSYFTAIGTVILFSIMHYGFMFSAYIEVKNNMTTWAIDANIIANIVLGIFMILIGNVLPRVKKNSALGVRTMWSMKNDRTWAASNRFGGIVFVIIGILIILETIIIRGILSTIIMLGIILAAAVICTVYSYSVSQKYPD